MYFQLLEGQQKVMGGHHRARIAQPKPLGFARSLCTTCTLYHRISYSADFTRPLKLKNAGKYQMAPICFVI